MRQAIKKPTSDNALQKPQQNTNSLALGLSSNHSRSQKPVDFKKV